MSVGGVYEREGKMKGEHAAGERRGVCNTTYYIIMPIISSDLKRGLQIIGFNLLSDGLQLHMLH